MKPFIFLSFLLWPFLSFSQTTKVYDSLVTEICNTLVANNNLSDTARLELIGKKHFRPLMEKIEKQQQENVIDYILTRLQRNCKEFTDMQMRTQPDKSDWQRIDKKPVSVLSKNECLDFLERQNLSYLEANGDTVHVTFKNGFWEDHFKDGTYSKLKFHWIADCEFEIEFRESNNSIRKNLSHPGDKYRYIIFGKENNFYRLSAEVVGTNQLLSFKMYY